GLLSPSVSRMENTMRKLVIMLLAIAAALRGQAAAQGSVEIIAYDLCGNDYTGEQFLCSVFLEAADGSKSFWSVDGFEPAWSLDGSKIACVGYTQAGLFVLNLRNWSIASVHDRGTSPAWSPDGVKIAFSDGELYVMNADGSSVVQLT